MLSSSEVQMNLACKPCSPWPMNSDLDVGSGSPSPGDFSLLFLSCKRHTGIYIIPLWTQKGLGLRGQWAVMIFKAAPSRSDDMAIILVSWQFAGSLL